MDEYSRHPNPTRFYRSRERMIGGVCGGIAERMGWDVTLVRIVAVVSMITGFFSGFVFFAYLIAWMVTPTRPFASHLSPEEQTFWRGVSDRPKVTLSNIRYKFKDMEERMRNLERSVTDDEWRLRRQFRDLES
ncbi:MAG: envelope stress response membrane protein PspC [Hirschia sp.]|nr:envelope stress response membrane protein PspC [Hirschia sp.]MBF19184.1 envelope stress response membrane protein PspC [Hirschia sp.]MBF19459.1 envelope stress response membrane protein PspC [Hirschia sp.]